MRLEAANTLEKSVSETDFDSLLTDSSSVEPGEHNNVPTSQVCALNDGTTFTRPNIEPPGHSNSLTRDVKIAVIGNVDSGKSTLVGVLTRNILDDGRGLARSFVFNFQHEQENGRSSSVAQEIMGFTASKTQVMMNLDLPGLDGIHMKTERDHYRSITPNIHVTKKKNFQARNQIWGKIVEQSEKIVTFLDLCGHERYLKTTVFGLVGSFPDYAMVVAGANAGIQRMTKEHIGIALALRIPIFIVLTKIDIAPPVVLKQNVIQLQKLLKINLPKHLPLIVKHSSETKIAATGLTSGCMCPIFQISNVTGQGMAYLREFIAELQSRVQLIPLFKSPADPVEFFIDGLFHVMGVGIVLAGTVRSGTIHVNQQVLIGPDKTGDFRPVIIRSIQSKRVCTQKVIPGQSASFSIRFIGKKEPPKRNFFRKGMVLLDKVVTPYSVREFEAEVIILHHATTIKQNYQAVIHCGVIRQAAKVINLTGSLLRTGDKGTISFRFMYHPEYLTVGNPLLFREGRTKGLGKVISISPILK